MKLDTQTTGSSKLCKTESFSDVISRADGCGQPAMMSIFLLGCCRSANQLYNYYQQRRNRLACPIPAALVITFDQPILETLIALPQKIPARIPPRRPRDRPGPQGRLRALQRAQPRRRDRTLLGRGGQLDQVTVCPRN